MPDRPENVAIVGALTEVWASIADACRDLPLEAWDLPTDCPGWSVRDQVSHLIGIERMLLGDPAPEPLTDLPEHVRNDFAGINEAWVEARRAVPGPDVLDEFRSVVDRRTAALDALEDGGFDVVGWSPIGEVPYREFMETRVLDSWAHEQDIRRAVDRPGGRNGAGEAVVLRRCDEVMPYVVGKKVHPPDGTVVRITVTGPRARDVWVTVDGGRARRAEAGFEEPTVTLSMDQTDYWRLGFGREDPRKALAARRVGLEGDTDLGERVVEAMPFMM